DRPGLFRLEALAAAGIAAALLSAGILGASEGAPSRPCAKAASTAVLARPEEPGEKLVVTRTDRATPAAGVFLYGFHTDLHRAFAAGSRPARTAVTSTAPSNRRPTREAGSRPTSTRSSGAALRRRKAPS